MKKSLTFVFSIFVILLLMCTNVYALDNENRTDELKSNNLFTCNSLLYIDYNQSDILEPIMPLDEIRLIRLNVSYSITGIFSNFYSKLLRSKKEEIELTIAESPDWCEVTITPHTIYPEFTVGGITSEVILYISLSADAPAFEMDTITIKGIAKEKRSFLNIFKLIDSTEVEVDIPFVPDYLPNYSVELPEGSSFETPPQNLTTIPFEITNHGNAITSFHVEVDDVPTDVDYIVSPEDFLLDVDESMKTYLIVVPNSDFNQTESINFTITGKHYIYTEKTGESIISNITIFYDS